MLTLSLYVRGNQGLVAYWTECVQDSRRDCLNLMEIDLVQAGSTNQCTQRSYASSLRTPFLLCRWYGLLIRPIPTYLTISGPCFDILLGSQRFDYRGDYLTSRPTLIFRRCLRASRLLVFCRHQPVLCNMKLYESDIARRMQPLFPGRPS